MAKSYTDDLAAWVKKREKSRPRQDKGLVAFIAVKDDVADAIEAGYALKTIWEHMSETGKIPYRYETFLKHVKKHIKAKNKSTIKPSQTESPPEKAEKKSEGFQFDSKPKKEELL